MSAFERSLCGAILAVTAAVQPGPANAQDRQDLQVTRHIGESITRRLTQAALADAEGRKLEELANAWVTPSYTTIDFNGSDSSVNIDIYQFVGGIDKRFGSFYAGASAGYARTEEEIEEDFLEFDSGTDSPSFAPYAAWIINDNVFVTEIAGYAREEFDDIELATDTAFNDLSVTGLLPLNHWVLTGRAGHRFAYTKQVDVTSPFDEVFFSPFDDDFFTNTLYVTGEVGYRIDHLLPYFRAIYERIIPEEGDGRHVVFLGVGATYDFSDAFSAGLSYQTELDQLDIFTSHQAVLEVRFRF
ncbi:MAG: autotransporter outer membrane beta-barrel domain-containing protein [Gammaproteobacteria bacterium]